MSTVRKNFTCKICGHKFAKNWNFQQHLANLHNMKGTRLPNGKIVLEELPEPEEPKFTLELETALKAKRYDKKIPQPLDLQLRHFFRPKDTPKTFYLYLLVDPTTLTNMYAPDWYSFCDSIFYVGVKDQALECTDQDWKLLDMVADRGSDKLEMAKRIWKEGSGFAVVHLYTMISEEEAETRAGTIINALKLENVTNDVVPSLHGGVLFWSKELQDRFGVYNLYLAHQYYLAEGCRCHFQCDYL